MSVVIATKSDRFAVILPAAGGGRRFGAEHNKLFATLAGAPLWTYAAAHFAARSDVARVILAVSQDDEERFRNQASEFEWRDHIEFVRGGDERNDSVAAALASIAEDTVDYVAIHDAARPLLAQADCDAVFAAVRQSGAALLAAPMPGTVKRCDSLTIQSTVDRRDLWIALTPQVFRIDLIRRAMRHHRGYPVTDDAQLVERLGHPVHIVPGSSANLKITYPDDLRLAEAYLASMTENFGS